VSALDQQLIAGGGTAVDSAANRRGSPRAYLVVGIVAGALFWLCRTYPSRVPAWAPWDFSWTEFLGAALGLLWFFRGVARLPAEARPPVWRRVSFTLGVGSIYVVLQTRVDYFALHMFFLNRIQHLVMHHLGPFLIALGCGGPTVKAGLPAPLARLLDGRWPRRALAIVQHPIVAPVLFVGLIYLWLIPPVHFRAMIDPRLYKVMNWSMVGDGLLFWSLVLDPRPRPPARLSFALRAVLAVGVMFPQIALGALIGFAGRDIYPYYAFCGRLFPSIGAVADQTIGGVVIWIPAAMMSVVALILVLNFMRLHEDRRERTPDEAAMAEFARRWTGR
jgi:putative membrane protein